ncbi:MAG: hypothetical protein Q4C56_02405 [Peptococcaceae bacterium]|nr:hypothetical protein [Peptococcaceae bacterium]
MSAAALFVISLVLSLVLGFTTKVNTGWYALAFAFINGVFIYGFSVKEVAAMWPIYLFLMLFIITLFYGFAISNGTLLKVSELLIYKSRNHPAFLPIVLFLICIFFAGTGAGAPAVFAFLSPVIMAVCIRSQISRVLATILILTGATIGSQLPFSVGGIVIKQVSENIGYADQGGVIAMNVWINCLISMSIFFLAAYIILKGYKTPKVDIDEPEPFTNVQKKNLYIIVLVMAGIILPALLKTILPSSAAIGLIAKFCDSTVCCAIGIILCCLLKVGNEKEAIHKVPFNIIIMICAMGMLIQIAITGGLVDLLSEWVADNVNSTFAPYMLTLSASIMSFFAATLGVVIPTLSLLVPSLATATGLSPILLFTMVAIPGLYTGCSPFSTAGGMALAGLDDDKERDKLFKKLLILPFICAIYIWFCVAVGIFRVWI